MSLDAPYDPENIFAKILRGEIPSVRVWEDAHVLAFMDVFPQSEGHVLVISKTSTAQTLLEVETYRLMALLAFPVAGSQPRCSLVSRPRRRTSLINSPRTPIQMRTGFCWIDWRLLPAKPRR